ncbi:MAG: hypothetical protein R3284_02950 [Rubricoccaceae bacterium]|nr:hypothetical protein [Rubricoccaceae bacterium]
MTPEEFERLKEAEKEHLRKMRALKQQYRDAKRKKGIMDALKGIVRPDLDDVHDEMVDKLTMKNIESEARFEIAMEEAGLAEDALNEAARKEAENEALQKAEAAELVRQLKMETGGELKSAESTSATTEETTEHSAGKTIGRTPTTPESSEADEKKDDQDARGPKTIGRSRQTE